MRRRQAYRAAEDKKRFLSGEIKECPVCGKEFRDLRGRPKHVESCK